MYDPKLHKTTACFAEELRTGDQFRINCCPFSPTYTFDHSTKAGVNAHTTKPDGSIHHIVLSHYDTIYKVEEVDNVVDA